MEELTPHPNFHNPDQSALIESWPEDQIVHIYRTADAHAENVETTPIDALPGLYRLESWSSDGDVVYYGYKWLGNGSPLPTYEQVARIDHEWQRWVSSDDWETTRKAWAYGISYYSGRSPCN